MVRTPLDRIALVLVIIGALNWLSIGLFQYDVVANIFGGASTLGSRIVYSIVGIGGLFSLSLLFRSTEDSRERE